jgi:predicted  nucleic acid-binding Zn-ribbon protein
MTGPDAVLDLQDLDLMLEELESAAAQRRLARLGFASVPAAGAPRAERERMMETLERRWAQHYDRAHQRYGRAVVRVRERVCLGCHITLPTSAAPGSGEWLTVCESCGRILCWR